MSAQNYSLYLHLPARVVGLFWGLPEYTKDARIMELSEFIGETTAYDKKEMLEKGKPKSWLKSVSAFANGGGGVLIFGVGDDDRVVGLENPEADAETISECIKSKLDPVPEIKMEFKDVEGKRLIFLSVASGQETPYYYIGDRQRLAFVRVGNESVVADRLQLKSLVMKSSGKTYDTLPSPYKFTDMAFTQLRATHFRRLHRSFEEAEFTSWGIIDEKGNLTNAGALIADYSPVRHSRIFCTRWNGLTMTNGLGEALDDAELSGSVIGQLQDAVAFVRNNSHKRWWKESDHREELPDYPERAVSEVICNAIIHRDYLNLGSEVHIDMYDDRLEVYSPGGMMDGQMIQNLDLYAVPSMRRNPLLADFFSRLDLMERRGSGMKKILGEYERFEAFSAFRLPEFRSNANEFHVVLWNLNYGVDVVKDCENVVINGEKFVKDDKKFVKDFTKDFTKDFIKDFTKDFTKARRVIYRMILLNPKVNIETIAKSLGKSTRQVKTYMKKLSELKFIAREGGRKNGYWKITDKEYEEFFDRI